ncbi:hypothetical protein B0A50_00235 [Salinomyces thailandicus]|uniref:Uncharacterized protein n=1 Tax=Salinomyces thailandicus TaxID=706561 RepID=A0A4U0UI33_9PEZI|nr:hypothetical protein B0A50_00235 [Salinomyces thailandica]
MTSHNRGEGHRESTTRDAEHFQKAEHAKVKIEPPEVRLATYYIEEEDDTEAKADADDGLLPQSMRYAVTPLELVFDHILRFLTPSEATPSRWLKIAQGMGWADLKRDPPVVV